MRGVLGELSLISMAQLISTGAAAVWVVILTHSLSVTDFGIYAAIMALVALVENVPDMGISMIAAAEVAQRPDRADSVMGMLVIARIVLGGAAAVITLVAAYLLRYSSSTIVLCGIAAIGLWAWAAGSSGAPVLMSLRRPGRVAFVLVINQLGIVLFGGIALRLHLGLLGVFVSTTMATFGASIIAVLSTVTSGIRVIFPSNWRETPTLIGRGVPIGIAALAYSFYSRIDQVFLATLSSRPSLAYYNVAYVVGAGLISVTWAPASLVLYPHMARAWSAGSDSFATLVRRDSERIALVCILSAVAVSAMAEAMIPLIFGKAFTQAAALLQITLWALACSIVSAYLYRVLLLAGKERTYLVVSLIGLLVNVVSNLLLIPRFGAVGACLALLVTQAALMILYLTHVIRTLPHIFSTEGVIRLLASVGTVGSVALLTLEQSNPLRWLLTCISTGDITLLYMLYWRRKCLEKAHGYKVA